ncbi:LysR family transcriptional regulator [Moritella viscosa]
MELSDLTIFCAVVEMGGISPAAHALNRVPSNITSRVKKLEAELNTALFIREKNRLRPSPTGEQFFTHAKEILAMAESAILKINNTTPSGRLRLGSIEAVAASRLSNVLLDFHQTYTEVELTPIFSETLVLVSSLLNEDINSPLDLGHNPTLLGFSTQCVYRTRLVDWVKQADILPKIVEINSYTALLNCVTAGMGVGFVPEKLLTVYPFKEGIKTHPLPTMIGSTTTNLIWRKDSVKSSMEAFKSTLIATSNI